MALSAGERSLALPRALGHQDRRRARMPSRTRVGVLAEQGTMSCAAEAVLGIQTSGALHGLVWLQRFTHDAWRARASRGNVICRFDPEGDGPPRLAVGTAPSLFPSPPPPRPQRDPLVKSRPRLALAMISLHLRVCRFEHHSGTIGSPRHPLAALSSAMPKSRSLPRSFALALALALSIWGSFAQLRDEEAELKAELKSRCVVCGISRNEFDRGGNVFYDHITHDHNMWVSGVACFPLGPARACLAPGSWPDVGPRIGGDSLWENHAGIRVGVFL